jgi:hypothetical protein
MIHNTRNTPMGSDTMLVRLVRDNLYFPAGTMLCINREHFQASMYEEVVLHDPDVATLLELVHEMAGQMASLHPSDLPEKVQALSEHVATLTPSEDDPTLAKRVTALEGQMKAMQGTLKAINVLVADLKSIREESSEPPASS